jgi:hypothetical protein
MPGFVAPIVYACFVVGAAMTRILKIAHNAGLKLKEGNGGYLQTVASATIASDLTATQSTSVVRHAEQMVEDDTGSGDERGSLTERKANALWNKKSPREAENTKIKLKRLRQGQESHCKPRLRRVFRV